MKYLICICIALTILSCSSAQLVDTWKNPDIDSYSPSKVLIVGLTPDKKVRKKFEKELKNDLKLRSIDAVMSVDYFENTPVTEDHLKKLEYKLLNEGYDTILFTKIIGVEDKIVYQNDFDSYEETVTRFNEDYLRYKDIYSNPDYYHEYKVYHAVTSLFCICPGKERELLWKGYIDIIDPKDISTTVSDYVKLITVVLEDQQLVN